MGSLQEEGFKFREAQIIIAIVTDQKNQNRQTL
jgi:hypothetical protein